MSARTLVSVVLPCFNAARFLPEAIDSLLRQTYGELEILALDDGSRDSTRRILERYAAQDDRVRVLVNDTNLGLIPTLNRGVAEAGGDFIARMDTDDVAAPRRIERQVEALSRRPEIAVVGTATELVDEHWRRLRPRPIRCREPAGARFMALFATPLAHVTLLARAAIMRNHPYGLSPHSLHTEDYELFSRMLGAGVGFLNLDEPLVAVRVRREGVSLRHETIQVRNFLEASGNYFESQLAVRVPPGAHRVLVNRMDRGVTANDLAAGLRWLDRIEAEYLRREPGFEQEVRGIADEQRLDILIQAGLKGTPSMRFEAGRLAIRYARRLTSPRGRRYLASKIRR